MRSKLSRKYILTEMNQFEIVVLPESLKDLRTILDKQLGAKQIDALRKTLANTWRKVKRCPVLNWMVRPGGRCFYEYENKDYSYRPQPVKRCLVGSNLAIMAPSSCG